MGGNGKHRWKISIHRSSSSPAKHKAREPPKEFVCPIFGSVMADPVVVSSGQTFERTCVQVCRDLGFSPVLADESRPDFSTVIPNLALKSTVIRWCDSSGAEHPRIPDYCSVEKMVRKMIAAEKAIAEENEKIRGSEVELLNAVSDKPPVTFSHAATELNHRTNHFDSSSEESVIAASPATPLPLATRPSCYSSSSSSSEIVADDTLNITINPDSSEEEKVVVKMWSHEVYEQEEGVISLRETTRTNEEARVSMCTPRLLLALKSLLASRYSAVQTNAVASLVNLSLAKANKVKIVRSGIVPPLIDLLKGGFSESQEHAAGALFSLALEDDNKMAIGVLGALQPLIHALRSASERARHDSALALYHLSLVQSNRVKLVKLGAVPTLLAMARSGTMAGRVMLTLCNLAACGEGRSAMLDANAVGCLVGMLRGGGGGSESEATRENSVAALYSLSHGSMRFKGLAKEARAVEVLREVEERGSERAREKAKRMLQMMRGRDEGEEERAIEGGFSTAGASRTRSRLGIVGGANSTEF
ncbi:U-box domain-containing protein 38-like [Malania oleifera]|uniref:U-box domain-containing protein 38-like n=1 Tax=Malania oleifera TaxID=397392 RepID=UPI0025ADA699|nr:U-box domain-containing protein 38-like [Malania oleifera]